MWKTMRDQGSRSGAGQQSTHAKAGTSTLVKNRRAAATRRVVKHKVLDAIGDLDMLGTRDGAFAGHNRHALKIDVRSAKPHTLGIRGSTG